MSPLGPPPSVRCAAEIFPESQVDRTQSRTSQDADGCNAVPDEDATARRYRDGLASIGLQPHARHEHPWYPTAPGGNESIATDVPFVFC